MLISITLQPGPGSPIDATALSHLLRKRPEKLQTFELPVGQAHVFYPEYSPQRSQAVLLLEVDPVGLVRSQRFRGDAGTLDHYINDKPYSASSLLAVALGKVFRSAMTNVNETYPDLADAPLPLRLDVPVLSTRGRDGKDLARRLFQPLGWRIEQKALPLDEAYPQWGDSHYSSIVLQGEIPLHTALRQLYVLFPVLDGSKHYWVNDDEAGKLARQGEGWLSDHPERDLIMSRYLARQKDLVSNAQTLLAESALPPAEITVNEPATPVKSPPLRVQRAQAVIDALKDVGARRVVDVGSGSGALLRLLQKDRHFTEIIGTDVSARSLEQAARNLHLDESADSERTRIRLIHSSAVYRDSRIAGFDAVVLMEVIEHIDPERLAALEDSVFAAAAPAHVIVTTPNVEYNPHYASLTPGRMRHDDHRFEWTRAEFSDWASTTAAAHGYSVEFRPVGDGDPVVGSPTQMAIFGKADA